MAAELVSIILPAYNAASTIDESIASALAQTYENIELVIVDDGSTDTTADICRQHADRDGRIRYFYRDDGGVSAARNMGITVSRGDFVAFLDADDLWEKDKLESQTAVLRGEPDTVVLTGLRRFSGDGPSRTMLSGTLPPPVLPRQDYLRAVLNLENHEMATFGTALVRMTHLRTVGLFDENLTTAEDWDLWLRLAVRYRFGNINRPLRLYRKDIASLTTRTALEKTFRGQLYVIDKIAKSGLLPPAEIRLARMRKALEFGRIYRYQKMRRAFIRSVVMAAAFDPASFGELLLKKIFKSIRTCAQKAEQVNR